MGGHSGSSAAPAPTEIKDTSQITDAGKAAQAAYNESVKTGVAMEDGTYIDDGKSKPSSTSSGVKPAVSTQAAKGASAKPSSMQASAVVTG